MNPNWRSSITSRTLVQLGAAVGIIILVATAITYYMVFLSAERRGIIHLHHYTTERAGRLEQYCAEIRRNLETARDAYAERFNQSDPPDYLASWDRYFERNADGAWRSRREYSDDLRFAPLWAHRDVGPSPDFKRRMLVMFEVCERFLPGWVHGFRSLYGFTNDEMAVIGFDPALSGWVYDQAPDYDINAEEFGWLGTREANPDGALLWTGTTADASSGHSLVSVVLPVEIGGRRVISVAHDMWVDSLIAETTRAQIPGLTHMIFREDGRLIAYPDRTAEIFSGKGQLNMADAGDPTLASLFAAVSGRRGRVFGGYDERSENYYAVHRIPGPEWFYLTKMPRSVLREQAFESARWVLWSALVSLGLELLLLGVILRGSIEQPVAELVAATQRVAAGERELKLPSNRPDQLGELARSFDEMARRVRERDDALRSEKALLEQRVEERTRDLHEALDREREVGEMKSRFTSLVSHEFRTPLGIISSSAQILDRYFARLDEGERQEHLAKISESVKRMAAMMEEMLVLSRIDSGRSDFKPEPLALGELCRRVVDELRSADAGAPKLHVATEAEEPALADEHLVRHILANLLTNAHKYSPRGAPVHLSLTRDGADAIFTVRDEGIGIPDEDRPRLFQAFHRGSNVGQVGGTGLGLVIVRRACELHGGSVSVESRAGAGTTFTVRLPVFRTAPAA